MKPIFL